jgi:Tropinone reductase 1
VKQAQVARVVSFLCMDAASYVSGQVLTVDGGFTCDGFRYEA